MPGRARYPWQIENYFWQHIVVVDSCWEWIGGTNGVGYGVITIKNRRTLAHRYAYELRKGQISEGLTIDHLCRNRGCVNPDHLEAVTNRENILRGESPYAKKSRQTHCLHGHEFTPENTMIPKDGRRRCRTCYDGYYAKRRLADCLREKVAG